MEQKKLFLKYNTEFYKAFETFDLDKMENLWLHTDDVICIHPGWNILVGWEGIKDSWNKIFANDALMKFTIRNPRVSLIKEFGIVTCVQEVFVTSNNNISQTFIASTNIFKQTSDGVKLIYHHSSPIFSSDRYLSLAYN